MLLLQLGPFQTRCMSPEYVAKDFGSGRNSWVVQIKPYLNASLIFRLVVERQY